MTALETILLNFAVPVASTFIATSLCFRWIYKLGGIGLREVTAKRDELAARNVDLRMRCAEAEARAEVLEARVREAMGRGLST